MPYQLHDVVVVLPGITGSVLENAEGETIWSTSPSVLVSGLLSRGREIKALQLPDGVGDEHPGDGVVATGLMPDLHVLPGIWTVTVGYDRLRQALAEAFDLVPPDGATAQRPANYLEFAYDWRLSNRYNARLLAGVVEPVLERFRAVPGNGGAKLVFLTHSMGGLIARYYADVLGGHEITRKVITLGTPHRGALNALEQLVNGVRKGFGPIGLNLTGVARSMPSLYQLLPEYACIVSADGLLKTTETTLPELSQAMVADAMRFHTELEEAAKNGGYDAHPILARTQPTPTTARLDAGRVAPLLTYEDRDYGGDGTVPRLSAVPYGVPDDSPVLRFVMDWHGALPANAAVHVELAGILTATGVRPRPARVTVGVSAPDVLLAGETLEVVATAEPDLLLEMTLTPAGGGAVDQRQVADGGTGCYSAAFDDLPPGAYLVAVRPSGGSAMDTVTLPVMAFASPAS